MCGYTFYFDKDSTKPISQKIVKNILNLQKHRGPDFSKYVSYKNYHFFHNRLKIIDLSDKANQPMNDDNGNIILFNGEIYNYLELIKKFNIKNLKTKSDTEVILHLYNKLGKDFVKELNGIFTFLIYNKKNNEIFVARDRFGVKPLFYYYDKKKIIFSTEIKPILYIIKFYQLDFKEILEYISTGKYFHSEKTFFKNINVFPCSTYKIFNLDSGKLLKKKIYWHLVRKKELVCKSYDIFFKNFLLKFKNAIKYNSISDVKISLLLSSGNDSIFIHDFIKKKLCKNLNCFTYGWKNNKYNEIKRLQKINLKTEKHHKYIINENKLFDKLKNIIHNFEGPVGGFGTLAQFFLFKKIKKKKIKVAFSGEGADEFLLGYDNFKDIVNKKKSKKFLSDRVFTPDGFALDDHELINQKYRLFKKSKKFKNINDVIQNYIFKVKLPKLLIFYDKASALNGVEGRVPMLEHNLAEFLYANSVFFRSEKRPIKDYLNKNKVLFYDNKLTVSTPQREFFFNKKIANKILDLIKKGYLNKLKLINFPNFKKKYDNYLNKQKVTNSFFIWKILNAEYFIQTFKNK